MHAQVAELRCHPSRTPDPPVDDVQFRAEWARSTALFDVVGPIHLETPKHAPQHLNALAIMFLPQATQDGIANMRISALAHKNSEDRFDGACGEFRGSHSHSLGIDNRHAAERPD